MMTTFNDVPQFRMEIWVAINGLFQNYGNAITNALELPQLALKPST